MSGLDAMDIIIDTLVEHEKELDRISSSLSRDVEALTDAVSDLLKRMSPLNLISAQATQDALNNLRDLEAP